ncbi:stage V sporulation protein B [Niallia taxi]|uniref:stage V sporulation protein B n=1 Tax=Niallia taxi TaxID=2499688 RepID=UPI0011A7769D|nr:stage V sporulation protein B [Niallia taxi]MCT2343174.1 stage V sporulation protein B [Niallia taxi]MED3962159.1 stage V sporulation protein B [Niallia taxi]WOD64208.1 stage V sporulation protein B [Niallia taxi]
MSKFLQGTIILLAAGLITRVLGFINRIVIARFIGEDGVGLYMMVYPTLILVVTITQLGLPVAISKNVAEAYAEGNHRKVKSILVVALSTTLGLALVFTPLLYLLAPFLAETLFNDSRTLIPMMAIAPIIPIIAVSSVLRGYFQGKQTMKPAAVSQVIEQVIRITLIAVLTKAFLPMGIEYAAAGAMLAGVIGELASLLYLLTSFKWKKGFSLRNKFLQYMVKGKNTFQELMQIALPTTGSRMIGSVAWFLEPIVVAQSLALAGLTAVNATKQYGVLTGFALPLLMLPSFFTQSLSTSLVPAISEANASGQKHKIDYLLQQALRFTFMTGGLAVIVIYVLAEPLMTVMYGSTKGTTFILLMAPFFILNYYQGPLQAALQALNLARAAMINSFIGAAVKTGVILLLASRPEFGIYGVAIALIVGFVLVTMLHFATIAKSIGFSIYVKDYVKMIAVIFVVGYTGTVLAKWAWTDSLVLMVSTDTIIISLLYLILLFVFKLLKKEDIRRIPWIGPILTGK